MFSSFWPWLFIIWYRFCYFFLSFIFASHILPPLSTLFLTDSANFEISALLDFLNVFSWFFFCFNFFYLPHSILHFIYPCVISSLKILSCITFYLSLFLELFLVILISFSSCRFLFPWYIFKTHKIYIYYSVVIRVCFLYNYLLWCSILYKPYCFFIHLHTCNGYHVFLTGNNIIYYWSLFSLFSCLFPFAFYISQFLRSVFLLLTLLLCCLEYGFISLHWNLLI